jgi:hypothetical protein
VAPQSYYFALEKSINTMEELNHVAAEPVAVVEQTQNGDVQAAEAVGPKQAEPEQPSPVSDEEVKQRLLVLLGNSDLNQTTGAARGGLVAAAAAAVAWFSPQDTCVLLACLGNPLQRRCSGSSWSRSWGRTSQAKRR